MSAYTSVGINKLLVHMWWRKKVLLSVVLYLFTILETVDILQILWLMYSLHVHDKTLKLNKV